MYSIDKPCNRAHSAKKNRIQTENSIQRDKFEKSTMKLMSHKAENNEAYIDKTEKIVEHYVS